jgi:hypothetical protein
MHDSHLSKLVLLNDIEKQYLRQDKSEGRINDNTNARIATIRMLAHGDQSTRYEENKISQCETQ